MATLVDNSTRKITSFSAQPETWIEMDAVAAAWFDGNVSAAVRSWFEEWKFRNEDKFRAAVAKAGAEKIGNC